jgi:hypothetical protein
MALMSVRPPTTPPVAAAGLRSRSMPWWVASALVLLIGYADLWRGGETLAPVLLVLGYCVLVPVAILR